MRACTCCIAYMHYAYMHCANMYIWRMSDVLLMYMYACILLRMYVRMTKQLRGEVSPLVLPLA